MAKKTYNFGIPYLLNSCKLGIAMIRGERHYWLSDGYANYLITDMKPETREVTVQVWHPGVVRDTE